MHNIIQTPLDKATTEETTLIRQVKDTLKNILDVCTTKEEGENGPELVIDANALYTSLHMIVYVLEIELIKSGNKL